MKSPIFEEYLRNKGIRHFIDRLKALELEAKKRQDIFFTENLNGFKKYKINGGK